MKKIMMGIFFISILFFVLAGCEPDNSFVFDGCIKVELTNGTNGDRIEIIDNKKIKTISGFFSIEPFKKGEISSNSTGWRYRLKFYNNNDLIEDITVMAETKIRYSDYFYETKNNNIKIIYLDELFDGNTPYKPVMRGYITNINAKNRTFDFDEIEWIILHDVDRIEELGIKDDMPGGFYIYNPDNSVLSFNLAENAEFYVITEAYHTAVNIYEFIEGFHDYAPYIIDVMDRKVVKITEQYLP
jgi:hypothetical protein